MISHGQSHGQHGQSHGQREHVACFVREACSSSSQPMQAVNHQQVEHSFGNYFPDFD